MNDTKNEPHIIEKILEDTKGPIMSSLGFKLIGVYTALITIFGIIFISRGTLNMNILGMSLLGGAASVLYDIFNRIKKEEDFRMIVRNYKLFPSPQACLDYLYQNNLVFGRYNENSRIQFILQPILSIVAGLLIYFILRTSIQMSLGGNITGEPNIYFYGFFAFISGFCYERILDILSVFSNKLSTQKTMSQEYLNKIEKFETEKSLIKKETKKELTKK